MTNINEETWQAAIAERGEKAFELFFYDLGLTKVELISNKAVEANDFNKLELKPIAELVQLDIERYEENTYLMYAVDSMDITNNDHLLLLLEYNNTLKRKYYANAPFNLAWAKAGVAVQFRYDHRWFDCAFKQMMNERIAVLSSPERPSDLIAVDRIRHPFPPVTGE